MPAESMADIERRLSGTEDLHTVVKTMKSMAAVNIHHFQQAVESVERYYSTIIKGLKVVLRDLPDLPDLPERPAPSPPSSAPPVSGNKSKVGLIFYGSEQGMVGQFNEKVVEKGSEFLKTTHLRQGEYGILAMGQRISASLSGNYIPADEVIPISGSLVDITPMVRSTLFVIDSWRQEEGITEIRLFYNKPRQGSAYLTVDLPLLPVDPEVLSAIRSGEWDSPSLPIYSVPREVLLSRLIREYLFVFLYRAFVESLASENAARLASMQAAENNIQERLDELHTTHNRLRQTAITEELLDITAGFQALEGGGR